MKKTIALFFTLLLFMSSYAQSLDELETRRTKEIQMRNNQSQSITDYTSHGIDWEEIFEVEDDRWGMSYSYGTHLPVSLSINYAPQYSYFSIMGEIGSPCSGRKYDTKPDEKASPIFYVMAAPGFYSKYFSIYYGVGALFDVRDTPSLTVNNVVEEYMKIMGVTFCHKPSIAGHIKVGDETYLTLNVGYGFFPKFKELNGLSFGIGFQCEL